MTDTATIPETHQPLAGDMLEHLRAADSWEVIQRPTSAGTFPARVLAARRALKALEHDLARSEIARAEFQHHRNTAPLPVKELGAGRLPFPVVHFGAHFRGDSMRSFEDAGPLLVLPINRHQHCLHRRELRRQHQTLVV